MAEPDKVSFEIFISHISAEKKFAHEVADALRRYGVTTFVAHDDITPGQHWIGEIQQALVRCDALASLHHPGFKASQWCEQEVGWMLGRLAPVVPLRLGEDPSGFEGQVQAISAAEWKGAPAYANDILHVLLADHRVREKLIEAMVEALIGSNQWSVSNDIIRTWKAADVVLSEDQFHRLMKAEYENLDVRDANAWPALKGLYALIAGVR